MNELQPHSNQLPETIEDLSRFVLVNEERIQALRAEIRAIKKVSLAKEVYEQKLAEAQEIGQITVEAAQKMGELLLTIQKQSGARTDLRTSTDSTDEVKTKSQVIAESGIERHAANEYQQMAQNPEAVQAAIQKAIDNGDVVSRSQVMKEIKAIKDQVAERDRRISELENRQPEVKEVVKEIVKEVVPHDYETVKHDAESYKKELENMQGLYGDMTEKWKAASLENHKLKEKANDPQTQKDRELELSAGHFIRGISLFLEEYGGYSYLMDEINNLNEKDRERIHRSVTAIYEWSNKMLNTTVMEVLE